jgi:hypothetical protein
MGHQFLSSKKLATSCSSIPRNILRSLARMAKQSRTLELGTAIKGCDIIPSSSALSLLRFAAIFILQRESGQENSILKSDRMSAWRALEPPFSSVVLSELPIQMIRLFIFGSMAMKPGQPPSRARF